MKERRSGVKSIEFEGVGKGENGVRGGQETGGMGEETGEKESWRRAVQV